MSDEAQSREQSVGMEAPMDHCRLAPGLRQSCLDPGLVAAYCNTAFEVDDVMPFVLRIGQRSDRLKAMMGDAQASHALFITAWNPHGLALHGVVNASRAEVLRASVEDLGLPCMLGRGIGEGGLWPPEPSLLVLGAGEALSVMLGNRFEQNAVVVCGASCVPKILLLR
ncbi:MAG: hypothetical protein RIS94_1659 [Pseudomonadota bacterium]|jgi:hypothetical protein